MNRTELIKILENGITALKEADSDLSAAKVLSTMGGICKHESAQIEKDLINKVENRLFKTRLDVPAE